MKKKPSYLSAAFSARPLGMPIPPNWFGLAAFGLLGAIINPGLWLIGAGLEGFYLWWLSKNDRFRATVDAEHGFTDSNTRYEQMLAHLDSSAQSHQYEIEREATEIVQLLQRSEAHGSQIGDVRQMAWLHLKLLTARATFAEVVEVADRERKKLDEQERRCRQRLEAPDTDEELRRSLEQQIEVITSRRAAHADALRRMELVDAELGRLRQQVSLVREQALLVTEEGNIGQSLDSLSASLNEANRWLKDQHELFAGLENMTDEPPPADLLASRRGTKRTTKISE
ncbi:MAG TPA: hypothetical protein VIV63_09510 [Steroidobacteraceae bacterium]